jgi:hypothetical protein
MPRVDAVVECPIYDSFRVQQIAGMFDVPLAAKSRAAFSVACVAISKDGHSNQNSTGKLTGCKTNSGGRSVVSFESISPPDGSASALNGLANCPWAERWTQDQSADVLSASSISVTRKPIRR